MKAIFLTSRYRYYYTAHFRSSYMVPGTAFMIFVVIIDLPELPVIFKRLNTDTYLDVLNSPFIENIFVRPVCLLIFIIFVLDVEII
jgi:hypothetical protein